MIYIKSLYVQVFPLKCAVQTYAWGKPGKESAVAQLSSAAHSDFVVDECTNYAELWMGTHPKGPCINTETSQSLSDYIRSQPGCVGAPVLQRFPSLGQLPFLFKVLSVQKALSIQAHPNKTHAEELHRQSPDKYPDPNHKPEMAIALTPFEGLCGFRPVSEIVKYFKDVPEFKAVVGSTLVNKLDQAANQQSEEAALRECFSALMSCDQDTVSTQLRALSERIDSLDPKAKSCVLGELFTRIYSQFEGDVGCFCIFLLNHMVLQPGEAMFLQANLPHAYLLGDCMECMACSDNVVRAGLTPKFKDVSTLCHMLDYSSKTSEDNLFPCQQDASDPYLTIYNPVVPDFTVARMIVPAGAATYTLPMLSSASILLMLTGGATISSPSLGDKKLEIHRGSVVFISADEDVQLTSLSDAEDNLMFRAYCQL